MSDGASANADRATEATPQAPAGLGHSVGIPSAGWIDHGAGGGCPVDGNTDVIVRFRDGLIGGGKASLWWRKDNGRSLWIHGEPVGRPNDIVAYWIVDPELRARAIEARRAATVKQGAIGDESASA